MAKRSLKLKFRMRVFDSNTQGGRIPGAKLFCAVFLRPNQTFRLHAGVSSLHRSRAFLRRRFSRKIKRSEALDGGDHDPYLSAVSTPEIECQRCESAPRAGNFKEETFMKFRPLHDRVVVRRIEGEEKTKGGIIIPDTAKEKPQEGEIIAAGPGARDESGKLVPLDVKAGDRVLFGKWSGTEVKIDGEELLIMKESDIMGVVEGTASSSKKAA
jgi:chaperonin GroES